MCRYEIKYKAKCQFYTNEIDTFYYKEKKNCMPKLGIFTKSGSARRFRAMGCRRQSDGWGVSLGDVMTECVPWWGVEVQMVLDSSRSRSVPTAEAVLQ